MSVFLQREIQNLKVKILELGNLVEKKYREVSLAIINKDENIAKIIKEKDYEVDEMEVDIEEEALKLLALYQPVAVDLRFIIAIIKINNDLERIGDITVNIANRVYVIAKHKEASFNFDYKSMIEKTGNMLKLSLDSLIDLDGNLAKQVLVKDDEIDKMLSDIYLFSKTEMLKVKNENESGVFINMYLIARHLERIADHATNIAEEIIYMVDGAIVRHDNIKTVKIKK